MKVEKEEVEMPLLSDNMLRQWADVEDIKQDVKLQEEATTDSDSGGSETEYEDDNMTDHSVKNEYLREDEEISEAREIKENARVKDETNKKVKTCRSIKEKKVLGMMLYSMEKGKRNSKILKELCNGAPEAIGDVSNMCRFRCSQCDIELRSWHVLRRHLSTEHNNMRISFTDVPDFISRRVCHTCRICSEKVLCDTAFITRHLDKHHTGIKIGQYKKDSLYNSDVVYSNNIIGNLCVYECETCKQRFSNRTLFSRHLNSLSHGNALTIVKSLQRKVFHKCKLCDKSILCDKNILQGHFRYTHAMTIDVYCTKTGCTFQKTKQFASSFLKSLKQSKEIKNACEFNCRTCGITFNTLYSFNRHLSKHKTKQPEPATAYLTKGLSYQCKICQKHMICDIRTITNHMEKVHNTKMKQRNTTVTSHKIEYDNLYTTFTRNIPVASKVWRESAVPMNNIPLQEITSKLGDLCIFSCPDCISEKFTSWCNLRKHSNDLHKHNIKFDPKHVSVARYHTCLICPKAVLCDRYFLKPHLIHHHKISYKKYESIFRQNGGETLPTFRQWKIMKNK